MSMYPPYYTRPETSAAPSPYAQIPDTHHFRPAFHDQMTDPHAHLTAAMHRLAAALEQFNAQRGKK